MGYYGAVDYYGNRGVCLGKLGLGVVVLLRMVVRFGNIVGVLVIVGVEAVSRVILPAVRIIVIVTIPSYPLTVALPLSLLLLILPNKQHPLTPISIVILVDIINLLLNLTLIINSPHRPLRLILPSILAILLINCVEDYVRVVV